jgi:iron complex outermembrane receptor protein
VYLQDEWNQTPQWAFHAGVRWEGIETRGQGAGGTGIRNRSSVATPLLHAVYKLDAKRRDQIRASLTQSYRTPSLAQLIARPFVATNNSLTSPDRYGNPDLKPERANGIDLAFERFLDEGGVLSANLFHRRITDVIRTVTSVNADTGRAESRPVNLGDATTTGLEFEARFRLDQAIADAPRVELRLNGSVFDSKVDQVSGPDNRIDGQPRGTLNLGADYRLRGTPLSLGGNLNWTPSVRTRLTESQVTTESAKLIGDVYALWTFDSNLALRVAANNVAPRDYRSASEVEGGGLAQTRTSIDRGTTVWQVRLEVKL